MNITSVRESTVDLEVMFNVHPDIDRLQCGSCPRVQTTIGEKEDGTIDVRGEFSMK